MSLPWKRECFDELVRKAVRAYWAARSRQAATQNRKGRKDAGTRGEVTGGQHLDGFASLFIQVIKAAGFADGEIHCRRPLALPGYYRAQKKWDIVVTRNRELLAAIELKSQSGSFGNNLNNRSEEVLGLARDFWVAYREKGFGLTTPWLGYFFLLEHAPRSTSAVRVYPSIFPPFPDFENTSYLDRYRILCERLILERDYSATALIAAPKSPRGSFFEPGPQLSVYAFAESLYLHLAARRSRDA